MSDKLLKEIEKHISEYRHDESIEFDRLANNIIAAVIADRERIVKALKGIDVNDPEMGADWVQHEAIAIVEGNQYKEVSK